MKILFIGDTENTLLQRYGKYFFDKGHSVSVIHAPLQSYKVKLGNELNGIKIISIDSGRPMIKRLGDWGRQRVIKKIIQSENPDIVHVHSLTEFGKAACFSGFHPLVFTPWGADVLKQPFQSTQARNQVTSALSRLDGVIAQSNIMIGETFKFSGPLKHSFNIHWGADLNQFKPGLDVADLREKLDIGDHCRVILSPRQFGSKYNIDTILKSIPRVIEKTKNVVFIFKYFITQGNLEPEFKQLAKDLNIEDHVRFVGRNETPDESHTSMPHYFNLADIWISIPSWDGGSPATLAEGFASGSFPIVSDISTNIEWVLNGFNGYLLKEINPEFLAPLILEALDDDQFRKKAIERNLEIAKAKGNFRDNMEQVEQAYQKMIQSS